MRPIKTNGSNFTYLGPTRAIADLPCQIEGANTFAVFAPNAAEREIIAKGGNIKLGIYGVQPIPPVSVGVTLGGERVPAPCDTCGKEPDDDVHGAGEGTHAYRQRALAEGRTR